MILPWPSCLPCTSARSRNFDMLLTSLRTTQLSTLILHWIISYHSLSQTFLKEWGYRYQKHEDAFQNRLSFATSSHKAEYSLSPSWVASTSVLPPASSASLINALTKSVSYPNHHYSFTCFMLVDIEYLRRKGFVLVSVHMMI